ncbi:WG repeat-containing protein [Massilia sp. KIM]|uniref:WG repeat-containing protein n=1 Tax=Massilia sp. KIM TaxID=1955422 RepID=UPI00117DB4E2|nr:WG repeat-containing protein [Massilia sp. KIM]
MKLTSHVVLGVLVSFWFSFCTAANLCPPTDKAQDWASDCFVTDPSGDRLVRPQFVKNIRLNKRGVALIMIEHPRELVAVNAAGRVVIPGIRHTGDFDYPAPPEGLGRYDTPAKDGGGRRCGYFDVRTFRIVVPAAYDYCERFDEGRAKVCTDCVEYCTVWECQDSIALGGQAMLIDTKGHPVRQVVQPTLADVCRSRGTVKIGKTTSSRPLLECVPGGPGR